jgi:nucleotide-binding universal stress UspA family protein
MILLGTHGRTGISHLLMGSVAEKVLRHSSLPLVIIPTREPSP